LVLLTFTGCGKMVITDGEDPERLDEIAGISGQGDTAGTIVELESYLKTFPQDGLAWTICSGTRTSDEERLDQAQIGL
jgi:hypothetical protein